MSEALIITEVLGAIYPRVASEALHRETPEGQALLVGDGPNAHMSVAPDEQPLVALIDGTRRLDALIPLALALPNPIRPMEVLALLQRLHEADLLRGVDGAEEQLFGDPGGGPLRLLRRALDLRIPIPGLVKTLAPGRFIPHAFWPLAHLLGWGLWCTVLIMLYRRGGENGTDALLPIIDPFLEPGPRLPLIIGVFIAASATLSIRGLWRGLRLRSMGIPVRRAGLQLRLFVPFFDIDDRERWAASGPDRLRYALAGLSVLALISGLAGGVWILRGDAASRLLCASANLVLIVALAPSLYTDGRAALAALVRLPKIRHEGFFGHLKLCRAQARRRGVPSKNTIQFAFFALISLIHATATVLLVIRVLLPSVFEATTGVLGAHSADGAGLSGDELALGVTLTSALLIGTGLLVAAIALVGLGFLLQLVDRDRRDIPIATVRVHAEGALGGVARSVFFGGIAEGALASLPTPPKTRRFRSRKVVARRGSTDDRLLFIEHGRCAVEVEGPDGRIARVATLNPGEFFGGPAATRDFPENATIRALNSVEILPLDPEAFQGLITRLGTTRTRMLRDLRNASFLKMNPVFSALGPDAMATVLAGVRESELRAGTEVLCEGRWAAEPCLHLIRAGRVAIEHHLGPARPAAPLATLGPGDWFGEAALLIGGSACVTARALTEVQLVQIPAALVNTVVLTHFAAAVLLDKGCGARLSALDLAAAIAPDAAGH